MAVAKYLNFDSEFFDKYTTRHHYLSRGASGNVYGPIQWNDMQLAIKQATFADGQVTDEFIKDMKVKKDIWTALEHKQLTRIHSVDLSQLPKAMFIVMEYAVGGSLDKTLRLLGSKNKLPIDVVTDWAIQISDGMLYLHETSSVHRDLKSSNILLMEPFDNRNSPHTKIILKITDFDEVKEHDHTTTLSFVGTCAYMAPEVLQNQWFSKASDVWSYGVVIWEILSGDIPHKDLKPNAIISKSIRGELYNLPIEQSLPEDYKRLLNKCWESDHAQRPSFYDIFCELKRMDIVRKSDVSTVAAILEEIAPMDRPTEDPVSATFISSFDNSQSHYGIAKVADKIYIVDQGPNRIRVYEDFIGFRFITDIAISSTTWPRDIIYSNKSKCVYISDTDAKCIWEMTTTGERLTKWLTNVTWPYTLSLTNEGHLLVLRQSSSFSQNSLEIYSLNATLISTLHLPQDVKDPYHVVQTSTGNFIILHRLNDASSGPWTISQLRNDGKLMNRFIPRNQCEELGAPFHLSLDSENNRLFVAENSNNRVILLNSNVLTWNQVLVSEKMDGILHPWRLLYDASKKRLFLQQVANVAVYEIN